MAAWDMLKLALLCRSLPPLLAAAGAEFPAEEAALPAAEGAGPAGRRARQAPGPTNQPYSFQSFVLGAEALSEMEPFVDELAPQSSRTGRQFSGQFSFDNLNFEGFQSGAPGPAPRPPALPPSPGRFLPSAARPPAGSRGRRPLPARMQNGVAPLQPSFASLPDPRRRRPIRPPPNADPRQRTSRPRTPPAPSLSFSTTSSVTSSAQRFQNFPSSLSPEIPRRSQQSFNEGSRESQRKLRKRLRVVTRAPARVLQQRTTPAALDQFPTFARFRPRARESAIVVTESPLVLECLEKARQHERDIEELENRTSLHIEYAQEKQIEISLLELSLEAAKNQSILDNTKIETLKSSIKNLTGINHANEEQINTIANDITKLELTFESEIEKKHDAILNLTATLEEAYSDKSKIEIFLKESKNEKEAVTDKLEAKKLEVRKLKAEKRELLQIIQRLAEIGNPALNFNTFLETDDKVSEDVEQDQFVEDNNVEGKKGFGSGDDAVEEYDDITNEAEYDFDEVEKRAVNDEEDNDVLPHTFMPLLNI